MIKTTKNDVKKWVCFWNNVVKKIVTKKNMHTCKSSSTARWLINVIAATGKASFDLMPFAISRNSSTYSCMHD